MAAPTVVRHTPTRRVPALTPAPPFGACPCATGPVGGVHAKTENTFKFKFRCRSAHSRGCPNQLRFVVHPGENEKSITVETSKGWPHTHDAPLRPMRGLEASLKATIDSVLAQEPNMRPKCARPTSLSPAASGLADPPPPAPAPHAQPPHPTSRHPPPLPSRITTQTITCQTAVARTKVPYPACQDVGHETHRETRSRDQR